MYRNYLESHSDANIVVKNTNNIIMSSISINIVLFPKWKIWLPLIYFSCPVK